MYAHIHKLLKLYQGALMQVVMKNVKVYHNNIMQNYYTI